jgi:hypothetical protein
MTHRGVSSVEAPHDSCTLRLAYSRTAWGVVASRTDLDRG